MSELTRISTDQAIAVLLEDAVINPAVVHSKFAEAAQRDPKGIAELFKATGVKMLDDESTSAPSDSQRYPLVIGQSVTHPGIPFGHITSGRKTINLQLIPDFLRDHSGDIVLLNGEEAVNAVDALNGGRGCGYEREVLNAVANGNFKDGSLILARATDLIKVSRECKVNPALSQISESIANLADSETWCVSSTQDLDQWGWSRGLAVKHVTLKNGEVEWSNYEFDRSRVLVLRGYNCG